jgi:hypothetical protein
MSTKANPPAGDESEPVEPSTRALAERWETSERTMQQMRKAAVPVHDDEAMVHWYNGLSSMAQRRLGPGLTKKIREVRSKMEAAGRGGTVNADYAEFTATYARVKGQGDVDALAHLKKLRDFALFKLDKAQIRSDLSAIQDATKELTHFSSVIHAEELRAQRLGRELGESFSAADVDRLGVAIGYWLLNSADLAINQMAAALATAAAGGPLDREGVRQAIEPVILRERVLAPLVRATQANVPAQLPKRFVDAIRQGLATVLEDGAEECDKMRAEPLPDPEQPSAPATS